MRVHYYSYRYAEEILQHPHYQHAWEEICGVLESAPLFVYSGKSKNADLDVVQQVMNCYFDRRFAVDCRWQHHPLATSIEGSGLAADFRKDFGGLTIQAEVQFGNMARWYSDLFKFQAAYSQSLIQMGLSVVPVGALAKRIDSNVANYERVCRELPSAELSITLPILVAGLEPDDETPIVDLRQCRFKKISEITGKGRSDNRWRIVNGYLGGQPMASIGPDSDTGPTVGAK